MKKVLLTEDNDVQNIIVADEDFEHNDYTTLPKDGRRVTMDDYYDPSTDSFVTPQFSIDGPNEIPNDGTTKTITVDTTARSEQNATFTVEDYSTDITVSQETPYTKNISTTESAETTLTVSVTNDKIGSATHEITVIEP